ncbi:MAG: hypothetical protein GY699_24480 [Desulfobacteraceae bacterium]|nr:hypothetical protein [Desulfobacteraceae bacterium]
MPKEIAHLKIAEKVFQSLPSTSLFHTPIHQFYTVFLYGAVAPDTPFYYIIGPYSKQIQSLAAPLHAPDSSSLVPILNLLKHFPEKSSDALAFAAGVCCHILSDTIFHPLVYYFSGFDSIHTGATTRHRIFETAMDFYFWSFGDAKKKFSLTHISQNLNISEKRLIYLFKNLFDIKNNNSKKYINHAIKSHQLFQYLFMNFTVYKIIRFLNKNKIIIRPKDEALCYPYDKPVSINFFNKTFQYKDPCQGTFHTASMDDLVQKTINRVITLLNILEENYISGKDSNTVLNHPDLPKICPDLPHKKLDVFYGSEQKDIENIIYHDVKT